jgi:two-component system response regulator HydG
MGRYVPIKEGEGMALQTLAVIAPGLVGTPVRTVPVPHDGWLTLGRAEGVDLLLADRRVSGRHARVRLAAGRAVVVDLDSRNGTWLVSGRAERRLPAGQEVPLAEGEALRVGPFRLVAGDALGPGVLLTRDPASDPAATAVEQPPGSSPGAGDAERAAAALERTMEAAATGGAWDAVLAALVDLAGARAGFLLACRDGRLLLRAHRAPGGAACLSEPFLAATATRTGAWSFRTGEDRPESLLTTAIAAAGADVRVAGVPFRARGEAVAVAWLEADGGAAPAVPEAVLDRYADLAAPLLAAAQELELERRCREAAEDRAERRHGRPTGRTSPAPGPIGASAAWRAAVGAIERAAPAEATVLLRGPSGAGKDELARLCHQLSPRRERPLVVVNAAALPETLVESELFGHDRGAFTGAERERAGAFERADGGTLLLDEIGDLAAAAQAKILRTIETGEVVRVGGSRRRVDVRLVAATHRDLEAMIAAGTFRADLYFRLRVVEVRVPALAERPDDVLPLVEHFLGLFRRPDGARVEGITPAAVRRLAGYDWPGNVRELRNIVERAVVLDRDGTLDLDDLPEEIRTAAEPAPAGTTGDVPRPGEGPLLELDWPAAKQAFEQRYFRSLLERAGGRVLRAAELAGVDRRTLSTKIREHDLRRSGAPGPLTTR